MRKLLALIIVAALGLAAKKYTGPGDWWVNNWGPASVAYVVFFMLAISLILPKRQAVISIAIGVCTVTCVLECLQLWQPAWLQSIRATFVGRSLLGTTFSWWDFPAYIAGAVIGWWLLCRFSAAEQMPR